MYGLAYGLIQTSRPSRARGFKLGLPDASTGANIVAPLAGAWIETLEEYGFEGGKAVAPLAGAWIETPKAVMLKSPSTGSRPSRARGLKHPYVPRRAI